MKYAESLSNATSTASAISKLTDTLSDLTAVGNEYIRLEPAQALFQFKPGLELPYPLLNLPPFLLS